jgi:hypothetical protein
MAPTLPLIDPTGATPLDHALAYRQHVGMPRRPKSPVRPVELKFAILEAIVEKCDGRPLDWKTVEAALGEVNAEVKHATLREIGRKK